MPVTISSPGDFNKSKAYLNKLLRMDLAKVAEVQAEIGVKALQRATPRDSGLAASSWGYKITRTATTLRIVWTNSDTENGYPVALMIQYGHGTGTGGYIHGIDYINPAMRPVFDQIAETLWKAVTSA